MGSASQHETHELLPIRRGTLSTSATVKKRELRLETLCRWRSGWKFMLSLASLACVLVLLFNTGLLLWAVARDRVTEQRGILFEGDCDYVGRLNTGLHLLINAFSTILLGASNYGMRCLCAPTRKDVDRVHRKGGWLNIGVPSPTNLVHVSGRRSVLWLSLLVSSVTLPCFILLQRMATRYSSVTIRLRETPLELIGADIHDPTFRRLWSRTQNQTLERLSASECYSVYDTTYQTKYGSMIMLSDDMEVTTRYDYVAFEEVYKPLNSQIPHAWMCRRGETCAEDAANSNWEVEGYHVHSCLSEHVPQRCKLQYSLPLTVTVIVANFLKAMVMFYMSFNKGDAPLLTTGDAVASFLHKPDQFSQGRCLLSGKEVRDSYYSKGKHPYKPLKYHSNRTRWYSAVQVRDWLSVILFWGIAIGICFGLIIYGETQGRQDYGEVREDMWAAKFGKTSTVNSRTLITCSPAWPSAAEWSRYAILRRGLRVSWNPKAAQRRSYFLSLLYRYAIPLMTSSAILHWLISQSIFLVGVDAYDPEWARIERLDVMTCAYTPVAIVSAISVGGAMLLGIVALMFRWPDSPMVVAGSCSLAIAAACHPNYDPNLESEARQEKSHPPEEDMMYSPVKWGAVAVDGEVGHCTFTSEEVEMPESGRFYQ
ncbi:hypothetical protein BDV09DRAFT_192122 [Aspergillus tetrazonus]